MAHQRQIAALSLLVSLIHLPPLLGAEERQTKQTGTQAAATSNSRSGVVDGGKYDLRYKFATGEVLRYAVQHRAAIRSTIDEVTQSAQTKTDSTKLWKVTDVLPNGDIEFMNVVERVHMVNQLPDRAATEYDSDRDKTPPPGFDDAARAIGVPLSVVRMTPRGKVIDRKVKHHQPGTEEDGAVVLRLPDRPVTIDTTWDEPFEVTVQLEEGGAKVIETRRHYKLASVATGIATIEVTYQVLSPINSHIESQLVQRLMSGNVRFDIAGGRIVGQEMEVDKRVLGFAGPTSSLQYIMRMEERLVESAPKVDAKMPVAAKPQFDAAAINPGPVVPKTSSQAGSKPQPNRTRAARPTRSSSRPRSPQPTKGYRR
jgi:hypothetical protein